MEDNYGTMNAISNAINNIYRETSERLQGRPVQQPQQQCPRCGAMMKFNIVGDGRMGMFNCPRCKNKIMVRIQ